MERETTPKIGTCEVSGVPSKPFSHTRLQNEDFEKTLAKICRLHPTMVFLQNNKLN
jgi:hypothetical protein